MKNKKKEQKENSLKWCYIGENKDQVLMLCSKKDWESICGIIEWARNKYLQDLCYESDEWNFGYTRENRRS